MKAAGYDVVTNSANQIVPNCKNVFNKLFDTAAFAGLCGNIVCVSSGFIETICALNNVDKIKLQVIFPNKNDIYWRGDKTQTEKYLTGYPRYCKRIFKDNIDFEVEQWGDSDEENEILIAKLLLKIAL